MMYHEMTIRNVLDMNFVQKNTSHLFILSPGLCQEEVEEECQRCQSGVPRGIFHISMKHGTLHIEFA